MLIFVPNSHKVLCPAVRILFSHLQDTGKYMYLLT